MKFLLKALSELSNSIENSINKLFQELIQSLEEKFKSTNENEGKYIEEEAYKADIGEVRAEVKTIQELDDQVLDRALLGNIPLFLINQVSANFFTYMPISELEISSEHLVGNQQISESCY
mgnify:CR=1 FL=1